MLETTIHPTEKKKKAKHVHNAMLDYTRITIQMSYKLQYCGMWSWHIPEIHYDLLLLIWQYPNLQKRKFMLEMDKTHTYH